jgi:hypothetical protein
VKIHTYMRNCTVWERETVGVRGEKPYILRFTFHVLPLTFLAYFLLVTIGRKGGRL